jgi:hypothetical protein
VKPGFDFAATENSIAKQDPRGRLDIACLRTAELLFKRYVEPACGGIPLWDKGLGSVVEQMILDAGVPSKPLTAVDVARAAGLLRRLNRTGQDSLYRKKKDAG